MVGVQSVLAGLVETFGPFLIPVTVFAVGVVGYTVLFLLNRPFRSDEEAGVVNLSAGTPERSATDNDHGASTRGVLPYGGDDGTDGDDVDGGTVTEGTEPDESGVTSRDGRADDVDGGGTGVDGGTDDRAEDTPRHND